MCGKWSWAIMTCEEYLSKMKPGLERLEVRNIGDA